MGYHTEFSGELKFVSKLTAKQKAAIIDICGEDCREHPEWGNLELDFIDLELNKSGTGLEWNGGEKSFDMVGQVNVVIREMRKRWPKFGLTGALLAQGESVKDRWSLRINETGWAFADYQSVIVCPHCGHNIQKTD